MYCTYFCFVSKKTQIVLELNARVRYGREKREVTGYAKKKIKPKMLLTRLF